MNLFDLASVLLVLVGGVFFLAGTVGVLRFPDAHTRLHALTKADNLGLGFVAAGLAVRADSIADVARFGVIWLLALAASATVCQLIARAALPAHADSGDSHA